MISYKCFIMEQKSLRDTLATNQRTAKKNLIAKHTDELAALARAHQVEFDELQNQLALARHLRKLETEKQNKMSKKRQHSSIINEIQAAPIVNFDIFQDNTKQPITEQHLAISKKLKSVEFLVEEEDGDKSDEDFTIPFEYEPSDKCSLQNITNTIDNHNNTNNTNTNTNTNTNINNAQTLKRSATNANIDKLRFLPITKEISKKIKMPYRPCNTSNAINIQATGESTLIESGEEDFQHDEHTKFPASSPIAIKKSMNIDQRAANIWKLKALETPSSQLQLGLEAPVASQKSYYENEHYEHEPLTQHIGQPYNCNENQNQRLTELPLDDIQQSSSDTINLISNSDAHEQSNQHTTSEYKDLMNYYDQICNSANNS